MRCCQWTRPSTPSTLTFTLTRPPISRSSRGGLARFDQTFVTVLDEGVIEESIAVLGHRGEDVSHGWDAVRLSLTPTDHAGRTEDAEACDFWGEHLYVLGSHFGSKDGPLEAKRAWIARVRTADLAAAVEGSKPPIEIARNRFGLHRAINDRLREAGVELRELGPRARERLVDAHDRARQPRRASRGSRGCCRTTSRSTSRAAASSRTGRCCSACAAR